MWLDSELTVGLSKINHLKYLHGNEAVGLIGKVVRAQRARLIAVKELEMNVEDEQERVDSNGHREI